MFEFCYDVPTKVHFGIDAVDFLGEELAVFGKNVLLVYGGGSIKKTGLYQKVVGQIQSKGLQVFELGGVQPNPKIDSVRSGAKMCKDHAIDVVLAVGGGSVIDCAKGICAGAKVNFDPWEFYLGTQKIESAIPLVTVLTNAATGSEMNVNSVVSNPETLDKYGTKGRACLPRVSILDPSLTYSVSPYQTACGVADIISHIFEVYFNTNPDLYVLDKVMEGLLVTVMKYAPIAMKDPTNYEARANIMWSATWALNGFIRGGKKCDWSCHPIEHELSAFYDISHGLGLAILTPNWLKYCLSKKTAPRYVSFGTNVLGLDKNLPTEVICQKVISGMQEFLFGTLGLESTLSSIGIDDTNFAVMAEKACKGKVIHGFIDLDKNDILQILNMSK